MAVRQDLKEVFSAVVILGNEFHEKGKFCNDFVVEAFEPYDAEIIIKEVIDFSKVQFVEMASGDVVLTNGKYNDFIFEAMKISDPIITTWRKDSVKRVVTPNFK